MVDPGIASVLVGMELYHGVLWYPLGTRGLNRCLPRKEEPHTPPSYSRFAALVGQPQRRSAAAPQRRLLRPPRPLCSASTAAAWPRRHRAAAMRRRPSRRKHVPRLVLFTCAVTAVWLYVVLVGSFSTQLSADGAGAPRGDVRPSLAEEAAKRSLDAPRDTERGGAPTADGGDRLRGARAASRGAAAASSGAAAASSGAATASSGAAAASSPLCGVRTARRGRPRAEPPPRRRRRRRRRAAPTALGATRAGC